MNTEKFIEIKAAIYEMGLLFNQMPNDEKITAYAKALVNYESTQIIFAFKQVIKSGSAFFPSLAEILKHLQPGKEDEIDQAPQIAAEMLRLIRWYGKHDEVNMLKNASPEARETFIKLGDTQDIRNSENTDTVRAQLERLARSVKASQKISEKNEKLEQIGIVLPMKRPALQKPEFSNFLTDGPA